MVPDPDETLPAAPGLLPMAPPAPVPHVVPELQAGGLPSRFLLQVDGAGSYLVLRDHRVTVGPAGSSRGADVGLLADSGLPTATIERVEDDYFLVSDGSVRVNQAAGGRKLLADGDKISLSRRCGVKFARPHAASPSAVLTLSGTRLTRGDARRVVLMDREMVVGPGATAHVRVDLLAHPAVFYVRDGRLHCRSEEPVTVNDRPVDRVEGIPLNANVRIGSVSLVITPV